MDCLIGATTLACSTVCIVRRLSAHHTGCVGSSILMIAARHLIVPDRKAQGGAEERAIAVEIMENE